MVHWQHFTAERFFRWHKIGIQTVNHFVGTQKLRAWIFKILAFRHLLSSSFASTRGESFEATPDLGAFPVDCRVWIDFAVATSLTFRSLGQCTLERQRSWVDRGKKFWTEKSQQLQVKNDQESIRLTREMIKRSPSSNS